jgi:hypothetical protein
MPSIVTPSNQQLSIDPYSGKLFDFDNSSSRVYLSRTVNNLLRVFGTDVILDQLFIENINYNAETETVSLVISPGKCIIDTTLIEFPSQTNVDLDVSGYDQEGSLLLFLSFRYAESIYENLAKFKLLYLDPYNKHTYPEKLETNTERILLAKFTFDKDTNTIITSKEKIVSIGSKTFEVYPMSNITKSVRNYVNLLFN